MIRNRYFLSYLLKTLSLAWNAAQWWTIIWGILLLVQGILPVATLYITRWTINTVTANVGQGVSTESIVSIGTPVAVMASLLLIGEGVRSFGAWVKANQSEHLQDHISELIHTQSLAIDIACYESAEYHDHLARAKSGASQRSLILLGSIGSVVQTSLTLLSVAVVLITYKVWLPAIVLAGSIPSLYLVLVLNRRQHRWWKETTSDRRWLDYYDLTLTHRTCAPEVRLFNLGDRLKASYQERRSRLRTEHLHLIWQQSLGRLGAGLISLGLSGIVVVWAGHQLLLGLLTFGDLALFYQALNRGQGLVKTLLGTMGQIHRNTMFIHDLFEFLKLRPQVNDPKDPVPIPKELKHSITFKDVTFTYPGNDRPVLRRFNLKIPARQTVAIVGDNGAGKTTVMKLLCRFYDPQSGCIEVDGVGLQELSQQEWRRCLTVLFQSPLPFSATAEDSIALGDIRVRPEPEEIQKAAIASGIHQRITQLARGYKTLLGKAFPGGTELSGGEWQRLALARAFFRQAPIILLDEPTSAMDPWAEADWLARFRTLARDRTAIVITHRLPLAVQADLIYVMRSGQIVESGSHDELMAKDGYYAVSWRSQMQGDLELETA
ncbi:MAG: ABC transporter ATP-binding protein [Cyanobacteria bacterium P01_F01_bin.150]